MSKDDAKNSGLSVTSLSGDSGMTGDELGQVRELLFGGTIREIERQREALQKDVNTGFAEADQMTNRRLDDVMRRLDALHQEIARDREDRQNFGSEENKRIDNSLVKLASEQASTLAQESQRIDKVIESEIARIEEALAKETKRVDEALDAMRRQIESDKSHHVDELRRSVATERNRLSQTIRLLADGVIKDDSMTHELDK